VAEVSRIGRYSGGVVVMHGWQSESTGNPLMDRKVVGVALFGVVAMVAVVTSLTIPACSVVQRSSCSCSCNCRGVDVVEVVML